MNLYTVAFHIKANI